HELYASRIVFFQIAGGYAFASFQCHTGHTFAPGNPAHNVSHRWRYIDRCGQREPIALAKMDGPSDSTRSFDVAAEPLLHGGGLDRHGKTSRGEVMPDLGMPQLSHANVP